MLSYVVMCCGVEVSEPVADIEVARIVASQAADDRCQSVAIHTFDGHSVGERVGKLTCPPKLIGHEVQDHAPELLKTLDASWYRHDGVLQYLPRW